MRRESPQGYHFFELHNQCPRKWWFRYPCGLMPRYNSPPLNFGAAFHNAKAAFYTNHGDEDTLYDEFERSTRALRRTYEEKEVYESHLLRGPVLLQQWYQEYGKRDFQLYDVVCVEEEFGVTLPNGYMLTLRPDVILRDRYGILFIVDTKTSSFSVTLTQKTMEFGDQSTTYIWGVKKLFPMDRLGGLMVDVAYWNKNSQRPDNIRIFRTDYITRSDWDLEAFEIYTMDKLHTIASRMTALESGDYEPIHLFGRDTEWCFSYHQVCPYIEICRTDYRPGKPPHGFVLDPWSDKDFLSKMAKDFDLRRHAITRLSQVKKPANRVAKEHSRDDPKTVRGKKSGGTDTDATVRDSAAADKPVARLQAGRAQRGASRRGRH